MATLHFPHFPITDRPVDYPDSVVLEQRYPSVDAGDIEKDTFTITIQDDFPFLTSNNSGMKRVFRTNMQIESSGKSVAVVCKLAMGRTHFVSLDKEAQKYEKNLKDLQGTVIPHIYGFFTGKSFDGITGVLVMEDCGEPLRFDSGDPKELQQGLVDAMVALHQRGGAVYTRGGLLSKNHVLARRSLDGKLRVTIISFRDTSIDHPCKFKGKLILGEPTPEWEELCEELDYIIRNAHYYTMAEPPYTLLQS
ncbi:hypothetical protein L226DRAFT_562725 [Lentinus tigrinus ALCF2SS1-7]|uniref:Protein kinase domain-containing protein n=1 Tax=Lentinus tigrinus ALCF2SS1-6 TaxID=1328759 RepID=A0A5C2RV02_9APHY|nr:hypothetical protein L227DRAFT_579625 [Lentinus tigrinus ALCF2SS1-6]RPD70713.1 hypothetical protein L226DRAFT_562725 [Lentinus tigrinus ALCF2SS1-7]